jgi:hypothetical protein
MSVNPSFERPSCESSEKQPERPSRRVRHPANQALGYSPREPSIYHCELGLLERYEVLKIEQALQGDEIGQTNPGRAMMDTRRREGSKEER